MSVRAFGVGVLVGSIGALYLVDRIARRETLVEAIEDGDEGIDTEECPDCGWGGYGPWIDCPRCGHNPEPSADE